MRRTWGKIYKVSPGSKISFGAVYRSAGDARAIIYRMEGDVQPCHNDGNREIRAPPIVDEKKCLLRRK